MILRAGFRALQAIASLAQALAASKVRTVAVAIERRQQFGIPDSELQRPVVYLLTLELPVIAGPDCRDTTVFYQPIYGRTMNLKVIGYFLDAEKLLGHDRTPGCRRFNLPSAT